jgi:hypothetical protein
LGLTCPDGFTHFIDKCIWIPPNLPVSVTFAEATVSCLSAGQQILNVGSLYLHEGLIIYLKDTAATANLWVGPVEGFYFLYFFNI